METNCRNLLVRLSALASAIVLVVAMPQPAAALELEGGIGSGDPGPAVEDETGSPTGPAPGGLPAPQQEPVIEVDPESLAVQLSPGEMTDETLTIGNAGDGSLDWLIGPAAGVLFDSGPLITHPGAGPGGTDHSVLQVVTLGMLTLGANVSLAGDARIADTFTVDAGGWQVNALSFFAYQTGSPTTSTFTGVNYQIWDGPPNDPASSVVFGDPATNRIRATDWIEGYRVSESTVNTQRPLMLILADGGFALDEGTYWVDYQLDGTLASGPWQPPITITGQTTTGQAMQFFAGAWGPFEDSGTLTQQGSPFLVRGAADGSGEDCEDPADVPWLSVAPDTGSTGAGGSDEVTVTFDATELTGGTVSSVLCVSSNDQTNPVVEVPVTLTVGGGEPVVCDETITGLHDGPLTVTEGTTCLAAGAQVLGEVNVAGGAGLVATAAVIQGPVSALGAETVDLAYTQVTGPVLVSGATGQVSLFGSQVTGGVSLAGNNTTGAAVVSGNTIIGSLSCLGNQPAPTDLGLPNTATGGSFGQCEEL